MNKYKICVYAICKNEVNFVDRWMAAVGEADMVVVTDTGSDDGTVEKLRASGAVVHEEKITPWRFDTARNRALNHVPEDVDICVSNDLDEVFEPGWREKLENAWQAVHTRASYLFTWSYNADGTPNKQFKMEKIHRRHGFRWVHPVHEVLEYYGTDEDNTVFVKGLVLNHYPDLSKPRSQYLPLLELSSLENPQDDRTMFWLGREYIFNGQHEQGIETLKKHLALPSARWDEERSASMRYIGEAYDARGEKSAAKAWFFRALAECQHVREPYLSIAKFAYAESDWPLVYAMVKKALMLSFATGSYLTDPECWGYSFYDLGAISAFSLGLYEEALLFAANAAQANKNDARLMENLRIIEAKAAAMRGGRDG